MTRIKKIIKGCIQCGFINFLKYNYFSNNIIRDKDCFFFPFKGSIIAIDPLAKAYIKGDFLFNAGKYKNSRAESYLILDNGSQLTINNRTRINYGSTIHINNDAEIIVGSLTTNVGVNIQAKKRIVIGEDCMFGRNTTVFDSSFHPTGASIESMKTNMSDVIIGDHVWIGAYAFVVEGTHISNGCMIGSCAYVSGDFDEATTVACSPDKPAMVGYMWARSESQKDLEMASDFYSLKKGCLSVDERAIDEYRSPILNILQKRYPSVDFNSSSKLITDHVLDSLTLISIVKLFEDKFNVHIPYNEICAMNFDSIEYMAGLLYKLREGEKIEIEEKREQSYPEHKDEYTISAQNTLIEYVKTHAERNPHKIAVFSCGEFYTYKELYDFAKRYGSFLHNKGLNIGDRVVVKSKQSVEYIIIYLAVHYAGGVITTVEKTTPNDKIIQIANIVDAKIVISDNDKFLDGYIYADTGKVFEDISNTKVLDLSLPKRTDSADILFTTGTTGESKGVELSHAAVIAGAENIAYGCEMKRDTVLVVPNPLSHSNAIKNLGACLITGCSFYVLDGMTDLKAFFDALDCNYGHVATVLPPAAIRTLFQLAKEKLAEYNGKLDYLMAAMAPLLEPDRDALRELLPKTRLYNHYGCSESSSICIYDFNKYAELKNCVGKAMPHSKVFFVNDKKQEIKSSSSNLGLLAVEGDATMKGYYKAPELTDTIKNGNVIYTKDVGYIDENGFVYVLGRDDDVINVGGIKVSPLEVEAAASAYDGVADCICIGVKDDISGQALKLLIVPGNSFEMESLRCILNDKLQGYKNPGQIEIVKKIERTFNGKLNRKAYKGM